MALEVIWNLTFSTILGTSNWNRWHLCESNSSGAFFATTLSLYVFTSVCGCVNAGMCMWLYVSSFLSKAMSRSLSKTVILWHRIDRTVLHWVVSVWCCAVLVCRVIRNTVQYFAKVLTNIVQDICTSLDEFVGSVLFYAFFSVCLSAGPQLETYCQDMPCATFILFHVFTRC